MSNHLQFQDSLKTMNLFKSLGTLNYYNKNINSKKMFIVHVCTLLDLPPLQKKYMYVHQILKENPKKYICVHQKR